MTTAPLPASNNTLLDIVDADDNVVGQALRADIHRQGLQHREVHIYMATRAGEIVFQRRSESKDSWPGYLDASVGGHVEAGQSYEEAALREAEEEAGLMLTSSDLVLLEKYQNPLKDNGNGNTNNCFRTTYGYVLNQPVESLKVEIGDGAGFVAVPLARLESGDVEELKMIPALLDARHMGFYRRLVEVAAGQLPVITGR